MQVQVIQQSNDAAAQVLEISDHVFGACYNEALIHQIVTAYLAGARAGTKGNKSRSEVRGGGIKPWRQKGTGRARVGSIRSPLWRGGGVTFSAKTRNYAQKVNRKSYAAAMRSIIAELLRQNRLKVIDDIEMLAPKTKELVAKLQQLQLQSVLFITMAEQQNLILAARNIPKVDVIEAQYINPVNLLTYDNIVITVDALKQVEEKLS